MKRLEGEHEQEEGQTTQCLIWLERNIQKREKRTSYLSRTHLLLRTHGRRSVG